MITCPKCANSLPDWSQFCQFCQADLKGIERPKADTKANPYAKYANYGPAKWIWPAYYAVSAYFVLSGLLSVLNGVMMLHVKKDSGAGDIMQTVAIGTMIIGSIVALIGIGLIAKVEIVRGIVNVLCWIRIVGSSFSLLSSLLAGGFIGPIALLWAFLNVVDIATSALMIYLIGETD